VQTSRSAVTTSRSRGSTNFTSPARSTGFFGGAAGPGKTKALLWGSDVQALRTPGCDTLLLRRTFPELESSLLNYFRRDVPKKMLSELQRSETHRHLVERIDYAVRLLPKRKMTFINIRARKLLFIGLDELTHFTLKQWQFLTSRKPLPDSGKCCVHGRGIEPPATSATPG